MADQRRLTEWILARQEALDLQVREFTWIQHFFPGWTDVEVSVAIDGTRFVGRGADRDEDVALGKATCEAIERYLCRSHGISSIGVAGHVDQNVAMEYACRELVERTLIGFHIESGVSMVPLLSEEIRWKGEDRAQALIAKLHILKAQEYKGLGIFLCLAEGVTSNSGFGGILGLGCDVKAESAVTKAKIECLRNFTAYSTAPVPPMSMDEFRLNEKPESEDRRRLLLNETYCAGLMAQIAKERGPTDPKMGVPEMCFSWRELIPSSNLLKDAPLHFYQCQDENRVSRVHLEFVG